MSPSRHHDERVERSIKWLEQQGLTARTGFTFTFLRDNGEICTFTPDVVGIKNGSPFLFIEIGSLQLFKASILVRLIPFFHWPYYSSQKEPHIAGGCWECMVDGQEKVQIYVGGVREVAGRLLSERKPVAAKA